MEDSNNPDTIFHLACREPLILYPRFSDNLILMEAGISSDPLPTIPIPDDFKNTLKRKGNGVDFVVFHNDKICEIWYAKILYTHKNLPQELRNKRHNWAVFWKSVWNELTEAQRKQNKERAIILEDNARVFAVIDAKSGKSVPREGFIKLKEDAELLRAEECYLIVRPSALGKVDGFNTELINDFPAHGR